MRSEAATYTSGVRTRDRESGEGGSGRRFATTNGRAGEADGSNRVGTDDLWRVDLVKWAIVSGRRGKGERSPTKVAAGVLGTVLKGGGRRDGVSRG